MATKDAYIVIKSLNHLDNVMVLGRAIEFYGAGKGEWYVKQKANWDARLHGRPITKRYIRLGFLRFKNTCT